MNHGSVFPCSGCGTCNFCANRAVLENILPPCTHEAARKAGAQVSPVIPRTEILPDESAMSRRCAELIRDCLKQKPDALLCLPAGNTAIGTYQELVRMVNAGELDISQARFVSLDDWVGLSADAREDDCTHFMMRHCYGPLNIPADHMTLFDTYSEDLEAECRKIDQVIFDNGGVDFMLLGLGMNGHLGLNEPGAEFHNYSHVMGLSDVTKSVGQKYFSQQAALSGGITVGIQHMFEAKQVVLQICGKHKQDIVRRMYTTGVTTDLPGSVFQVLPKGSVIMDAEAAEKIRDLI